MSLRTTMTTLEKAIQKSMTRPRCLMHQTSFLWLLFQEFVRSTTQRFVACGGAGLPFSEIVEARARTFSFSWVVSES